LSSGAVNEYVAETTSISYTVTGLEANTSYYFAVSAAQESRESLPSTAAQGKTSLASPQGLSVTGQTGNSISLSWQAVSSATGYKVYKGSSSGAVNEYVAETTSTSYTVTGLAANTSYYFAVSAIHESIESLPSVAVKGQTSNQCTVTFDVDGGSPATQTRTVENGVSLGASNMPSVPSKSGYIFKGWHTAAEGGGSEFTAATIVTGDIRVYAWWGFDTSIQYTVSFDTAEGSPVTRTVTNGSSLGSSNMPPAPDRTGYIFNNWYTATNGGGSEFTAATIVTGDMTVYAWWKAQYTVTFDADGGSPEAQTRTVTNGDAVGSSNMPPAPDRTGYIFNNWYTATNGGGSEFTAGTIVTGNITVYAWWSLDTSIQYTITFDAAGGSPATQTLTVTNGDSLGSSGMPSEPTMVAYIFDGWHTTTDGGGSEFTAATPVTGDMTVYAWWKMPDTLSLADTLTWISNNAVEGGVYTIVLKNNETISPKSLSYDGKTVGITLTGGTTERTVSLSTIGSLFTVENGVTLTLDNNVTLQGHSSNTNSPLVYVNSGGTLVMNTGSKISDNTSSYYNGGGVYVSGTFTMNGGEISSNTSPNGGGGVYVSGTFTMNGGKISGNTSSSGGGVYVDGIFTMNSGTISNNISSSSGGGVYVNGTFTMNNGTISTNTSSPNQSFNWSGGGGVYVYDGTFTMKGGTMGGNSTSFYGGGVSVFRGTFTKQPGGVIYGSNESDSDLRNTATSGDNYGHAAHASSGGKRNTTAGTYIALDSAKSGTEGGWE
jgi:uncharacterized repeat protein (TIGR02543 family)